MLQRWSAAMCWSLAGGEEEEEEVWISADEQEGTECWRGQLSLLSSSGGVAPRLLHAFHLWIPKCCTFIACQFQHLCGAIVFFRQCTTDRR